MEQRLDQQELPPQPWPQTAATAAQQGPDAGNAANPQQGGAMDVVARGLPGGNAQPPPPPHRSVSRSLTTNSHL
jgi:hypothetical protein